MADVIKARLQHRLGKPAVFAPMAYAVGLVSSNWKPPRVTSGITAPANLQTVNVGPIDARAVNMTRASATVAHDAIDVEGVQTGVTPDGGESNHESDDESDEDEPMDDLTYYATGAADIPPRRTGFIAINESLRALLDPTNVVIGNAATIPRMAARRAARKAERKAVRLARKAAGLPPRVKRAPKS